MTDDKTGSAVRADAARAMEEARHEAVSIRHALDTIELEEALEGRDVVKDFRRHAEVIEGLLRAFTQRDARLAAPTNDDERARELKYLNDRIVALEAKDARLEAIVQEMRAEDWSEHTTHPLSIEPIITRWADQLAALGADEEEK